MSLVLLTLSRQFQQGRPVIPHTQPPNIQTEQPSRRSASWYDQDHLEIRELDTTLQCHCDGKMELHDEKLSKQPMTTVILCVNNIHIYMHLSPIYIYELYNCIWCIEYIVYTYIRIVFTYMCIKIPQYSLSTWFWTRTHGPNVFVGPMRIFWDDSKCYASHVEGTGVHLPALMITGFRKKVCNAARKRFFTHGWIV